MKRSVRPLLPLSLLLAGALAALVATRLRAAIGRAESETRAQDLFGKYRLIRRLASGGMGVVFEALYCPEGGFERRVAVKRIHPHLAATARFVDAFRAEAELSARLAHWLYVRDKCRTHVPRRYFDELAVFARHAHEWDREALDAPIADSEYVECRGCARPLPVQQWRFCPSCGVSIART